MTDFGDNAVLIYFYYLLIFCISVFVWRPECQSLLELESRAALTQPLDAVLGAK